jgi:hypothetical protein
VLLAPREHTKLTTQSVECVFIGYSAEHKDHHCWDLVVRRMQTSRDIVFNESHPFYLCPTTDVYIASLVDSFSFLLFSDDPPASLPIPRSTLPSSVSSSEYPHVVSDYILKPLVTQFYSRCRARLLDVPAFSNELSSDVTSSSFIEDVTSSPPVEPSSPTDPTPEKLVRRSHHLHRSHDCYSPSALTMTALSEPTSYHNAILHPE